MLVDNLYQVFAKDYVEWGLRACYTYSLGICAMIVIAKSRIFHELVEFYENLLIKFLRNFSSNLGLIVTCCEKIKFKHCALFCYECLESGSAGMLEAY